MDWLDWIMTGATVAWAIFVMGFIVFVILDSDLGRQFLRKRRLRKKERLLYELRKMGVKVVDLNDLKKVQNRNEVFFDKFFAKEDIRAFLRLRYSDEISSKTIDEIAEKIAEHYTKRRGKDDLVTLEELMYNRLWFDGCYVSETKTDEE